MSPVPGAENRTLPGAYLLVLFNRRHQEMAVGRLGILAFPAGRYVYCGSARGGLFPRVERHLRGDGKIHWHIDRLTHRWEREGAFLFPHPGPGECELSAAMHGLSEVVPGPAGFGASDCRCETHLFRVPRRISCVDLGGIFSGDNHFFLETGESS